MSEPRPIFIVGCPRSGTTLLRLMLDSHPHISCGPETSFLIDLRSILDRHWSHIALYGFDEGYWQRKIALFFATFQEEYARQRGKGRWAEKTPHYTPHLDFILTLFPESQIVHIIRDGRDVVTSHLQRWGYRRAAASVVVWRDTVTTARLHGRRLPGHSYHEVRYEALTTHPEGTLRSLLTFLNEPWDAQVLSFLESEHDVQATYGAQIARRQAQSGGEARLYTTRVGAWRRELPFPLKLLCRFQTGPLLQELGYL